MCLAILKITVQKGISTQPVENVCVSSVAFMEQWKSLRWDSDL